MDLRFIDPLSLVGLILIISGGCGTWFGYLQSAKQNNPFGITPHSLIFGVFVWGDWLVLGPFWFLAGWFVVLSKSWLWLGFVVSTFWLVRSLGEVGYWLLEQFATKKRNKPEDLFGHQLFSSSEAIYFGYQLFWQVVAVVSLLALAYLVSQL